MQLISQMGYNGITFQKNPWRRLTHHLIFSITIIKKFSVLQSFSLTGKELNFFLSSRTINVFKKIYVTPSSNWKALESQAHGL